MGAFRSSRCNINRLVNEYIVNTCDWIATSMFHFGKCVTVFGFRRFLSSCLFLCVATDRSTQSVERQTAIPFKLRVETTLKEASVQAKIFRVFVLVKSIIPCLHPVHSRNYRL